MSLNTSFRVRPTKTPLSDPHQTVDSRHQEKVREFVTNRENIEEYKRELGRYKDRKQELEDKKLINLTDIEFNEYKETVDIIKELDEKIYDIETNTSELDYYSNSYKLLYKYYMNDTYADDSESEDSDECIEKCGLENILEIDVTNEKSKILDEYLTATDKTYQPKKIEINKYVDKCIECTSSDLVFNNIDGIYVCHECGVINGYDEWKEYNPSYKERQDIDFQPQFAYKKINHFIDHLNNIQAVESVNIPEKVINAVKEEMKKERLKPEKLDNKKIRIYLKKHRLSSYYVHAQRIISIITGIKKKPIMDDILKNKLISMFEEVLPPWYKTCPSMRYNFFSYKYIIYKFCELLGEDQVLKYCTLLKDREKLYKQDLMWKAVCKILRWEFIPSV